MDNTVNAIFVIIGIIAFCLILSLIEKGINVIKFLADGLVGLFKLMIKLVKGLINLIKLIIRLILSIITFPFRFVAGERNFML